MIPTKIEKAVIAKLLDDPDLKPVSSVLDLEDMRVAQRTFTGLGFLTELMPSQELLAFGKGESFRWGKIGARLNQQRTEAGFLVYVDDGLITAVEGYTYGEEWPETIDSFELYALVPGMELELPTKVN
jgi:hypothetical protein